MLINSKSSVNSESSVRNSITKERGGSEIYNDKNRLSLNYAYKLGRDAMMKRRREKMRYQSMKNAGPNVIIWQQI